MSTLWEFVRLAGLLLLAWTVLSIFAVAPLRWWMRRRAVLNEGGPIWLAGQPTCETVAFSASGPHSGARIPRGS